MSLYFDESMRHHEAQMYGIAVALIATYEKYVLPADKRPIYVRPKSPLAVSLSNRPTYKKSTMASA